MAAIPGVQLKKNEKGTTTHISIDLRKHPEMIPILEEKGLLHKNNWEQEAAKCITVEELRTSLHQLITDHYARRSR
jgi:hypothetical protein